MTKLLMVATIAETIEAFLLPFAERMRLRGWRVDALAHEATANPACVRSFDQVWDINWSRNPLSPTNFFHAPRAIRELVVRENYDLVHVHTPVAAFVTRFALRRMRAAGRPGVIYTAHGFHFYQGGPRLRGAIYRTLERTAGRWTDDLIVINREDEAAARTLAIVPADRLHFMPGIGVDLRYYSTATATDVELAALRSELSLPDDSVVFLMVAEFIARKRHRDALEAFARCGHKHAVFAFAGQGPLLGEMQSLAESLGIRDRVRFLGYRKDIPVLMRLARATVLTSQQEGLPRSLMESMSLGTPAIGTRIRGITDLLEGDRGLLVPVGDVAALADAFRWMIEHPDNARAMGERARQGMNEYDLSVIVRLHEELYDRASRRVRPNDQPTLAGTS